MARLRAVERILCPCPGRTGRVLPRTLVIAPINAHVRPGMFIARGFVRLIERDRRGFPRILSRCNMVLIRNFSSSISCSLLAHSVGNTDNTKIVR